MQLHRNPRLRRLACSASGRDVPGADLARPVGLCPCCPPPGKPVVVEYDLDGVAGALEAAAGRRGLWRFEPLLPVVGADDAYAGDVGRTPVAAHPGLTAELGCEVLLKPEGPNPSGSFKDRGLAVAVALGVVAGAERFCLPTQGNAGVAASLFSARLGLPPCRVTMPDGYQGGPYHRAAAHWGAEVEFAGANIAAAGQAMRAALADDLAAGRVVDVSTFFEPGRLEGKKTLGLELGLDLGADGLPDWILYPTGGGTGLVGIWKGLAELRAAGLLPADARLPRLVAVQSERCAPVVAAFAAGAEAVTPVTSAGTVADGLDVPGAIMGHGILRALRESGGAARAVAEDAIRAAFVDLGRRGVPASYEAAATFAALRDLRRDGTIGPGERVLLLLTSGPTVALARA